jgi:hypothetical protein
LLFKKLILTDYCRYAIQNYHALHKLNAGRGPVQLSNMSHRAKINFVTISEVNNNTIMQIYVNSFWAALIA